MTIYVCVSACVYIDVLRNAKKFLDKDVSDNIWLFGGWLLM